MDAKFMTWLGWMNGVEIKFDQDCVFDNSKRNKHAMNLLPERERRSSRNTWINRAASGKCWGILILDISVAFMHARTQKNKHQEMHDRVDTGGRRPPSTGHAVRVNSGQTIHFDRSDLNPCVHRDPDQDLIAEDDDFLIV